MLIGVQVLHGDPLIGLSAATVHYQHVVTTFMQPLGPSDQCPELTHYPKPNPTSSHPDGVGDAVAEPSRYDVIEASEF